MQPVNELKLMKLSDDVNHIAKVWSRVLKNDGYCPCSHLRDAEHVCPCREAREDGVCHCGLYVPK